MEDSAREMEIMQRMQEIINEQSGSMQETRTNVSEVLKEIEDSMQSILQIRESTGRLPSPVEKSGRLWRSFHRSRMTM